MFLRAQDIAVVVPQEAIFVSFEFDFCFPIAEAVNRYVEVFGKAWISSAGDVITEQTDRETALEAILEDGFF